VVQVKHEWFHDPLISYPNCSICYTALGVAFSKLADLHLGPKDTYTLVTKLRELAQDATKEAT